MGLPCVFLAARSIAGRKEQRLSFQPPSMSSDRLKSRKAMGAQGRVASSALKSHFPSPNKEEEQDDSSISRIITGDKRNSKSKRNRRRSPTTVVPAGGADGKVGEGLRKKATSIHSKSSMYLLITLLVIVCSTLRTLHLISDALFPSSCFHVLAPAQRVRRACQAV